MKFGKPNEVVRQSQFRILYSGIQYRLLAFWDKEDKKETLVFATLGIIKKTSKVEKKEIEKAENIRANFLKKRDEKLQIR